MCGKGEQIWNPKQQQNVKFEITNKFEAPRDNESLPKEGKIKNGEGINSKKDTSYENEGNIEEELKDYDGKNQKSGEKKNGVAKVPYTVQEEGQSQTGE
ncbi:hypothetical protein H5410_040498 [Solanum commersonii]|uniref:Uncharacterized protein n=1 Tax=Solanum commersonii TaxID=4109 RepID=A0A9J5XS60_SOLCO|nr:hypothetical protein H5410_040498 [Solanum commersonii]